MARNDSAAPNFADYFTIGEAAQFLGVSSATLRNWDRSGKLKPRRHPQNGYRIYLHEDLAAVLQSTKQVAASDKSPAAHVEWGALSGAEHFVQFYETDAFLVESASGFVAAALRDGGIGVVVATPEHRREIELALAAQGIDVSTVEAAGQYISHDARETLDRFMDGDRLDQERFESSIGRLMVKLSAGGGPVHAFGEMVAILWSEGNREGAIALEQHWNVLAAQHKFAILCAYPIHGFIGDGHAVEFDRVCSCHTRVQPAESYLGIECEEARLRAVSALQQQVHSLKAEIEHRQAIENSLREADRDQKERLARLSSELRTPLAAIQTSLEELDATSGVGNTGRKAANVIRHQIERLTQRIDRIF